MSYGTPTGALSYGGTPSFPAPPVAGQFENILFLSSKEFDRSTIAASSSVSTLPASFLQDVDFDRKWRSASKVGQYLNITLARPVACNALAFAGHNLTGAGLVRIKGALSLDGLATPIVDTNWMSAWPIAGKPSDEDWPSWSSLIRWENDNELPCWRIEFADIGVATTYYELSRVWLGRSFQPGANVDSNLGIGLDSPDAQIRTPYGKTFTDPRGAASRRLTLPFSSVNRDDLLRSLYELQRYCGLARDFFCVIDPAATTDFHRYALQALFASSAQFEAQPVFDHSGEVWRMSLTLTESL